MQANFDKLAETFSFGDPEHLPQLVDMLDPPPDEADGYPRSP